MSRTPRKHVAGVKLNFRVARSIEKNKFHWPCRFFGCYCGDYKPKKE